MSLVTESSKMELGSAQHYCTLPFVLDPSDKTDIQTCSLARVTGSLASRSLLTYVYKVRYLGLVS